MINIFNLVITLNILKIIIIVANLIYLFMMVLFIRQMLILKKIKLFIERKDSINKYSKGHYSNNRPNLLILLLNNLKIGNGLILNKDLPNSLLKIFILLIKLCYLIKHL